MFLAAVHSISMVTRTPPVLLGWAKPFPSAHGCFCVFSFALDRDGGANGAVSREARNRAGCKRKRILEANPKYKLSEKKMGDVA